MTVYRNPATGALVLPRFARSRDRIWGSIEWDESNRQWQLRQRLPSGDRRTRRSGFAADFSQARMQRCLDRFCRDRKELR